MSDKVDQLMALAGDYALWYDNAPGLGQSEPCLRRRESLRSALLAALQAPSVPEGWKLAPEQWTSQMAHAGYEEVERLKVAGMTEVACWECGEIYRAMLSAAPPAPNSASPPPSVTGCHRSHPHENMDAECQQKTLDARAAALSRSTGKENTHHG